MNVNMGGKIRQLRREKSISQDVLAQALGVSVQAVSKWETGKTYPDLQILVEISEQYGISLDALLKEDPQMVQTIDCQRAIGALRQEKGVIDMFTGAGTGIIVSCLFAPASIRRSVMIAVGLFLLCIGWYKKAKHDQKMISYIEKGE